MKKKRAFSYIAVGLLVLLFGTFVVATAVDYETAWHNPDEIFITIGPQIMTLQEAIITDAFTNGPAIGYEYTAIIPNPSHIADDVLITVNGFTMTLQDAVSNDVFTLGATQDYTTSSIGTHSASSIEVEIDGVDRALQDAFTLSTSALCVPDCSCASAKCTTSSCQDPNCEATCQGTIQPAIACPTGDECGTWTDGCGNVISCGSCGTGEVCNPNTNLCDWACSPGTSRYFNCATDHNTACKTYSTQVVDVCSATGQWTLDCATDVTPTYVTRGTTCDEPYAWIVETIAYETTCADGECACDGAGICEGYSENGCDSCPFGWELGDSPVNSYKFYNCINPDGANPICESYKCNGIYVLGCWVDWTFTSYDWTITPA